MPAFRDEARVFSRNFLLFQPEFHAVQHSPFWCMGAHRNARLAPKMAAIHKTYSRYSK